MPEKLLAEDRLFMCKECHDKSGRGEYIKVRYSNVGGWSPQWEGRVCEHISAQDVLDYLKKHQC